MTFMDMNHENIFDLWEKLKKPTIALKSSLLQIPMFSVRISPRRYIIVALGFLVGHLFKKIDRDLFHDPYLH